jgi:hypothetical protein
MNKMLFVLLFAGVSFGAIAVASAGKPAKEEAQDTPRRGVYKKVRETERPVKPKAYKLVNKRNGWEVDRRGNVTRTITVQGQADVRIPETPIKPEAAKRTTRHLKGQKPKAKKKLF